MAIFGTTLSTVFGGIGAAAASCAYAIIRSLGQVRDNTPHLERLRYGSTMNQTNSDYPIAELANSMSEVVGIVGMLGFPNRRN